MLLSLCPDTIGGHHGCLTEINQRISALKARRAQIERTITTECIPKINAHKHVLDDACEELGRIVIESSDPFRDLIQNRASWNLGIEAIGLREKVDALCEQKRRLEEELCWIEDEIECLRNQRSVHVELIGALVCEDPACVAFLMRLEWQ